MFGWLKCFSRGLQKKLEEDHTKLFKNYQRNQLSEKAKVNSITQKLDGLNRLLKLYPYDSDGHFQSSLLSLNSGCSSYLSSINDI